MPREVVCASSTPGSALPVCASAFQCGFLQVAPTSSAVVELYIFLSQPCLATHILVHSAHGADDYTTPCAFDLKLGPTMDSLQPCLEVWYCTADMHL